MSPIDGQGHQQGPDDGSTGAADEGADADVADAKPGRRLRGEGQEAVRDNDGCRDRRNSRGDKGMDNDKVVGAASCRHGRR